MERISDQILHNISKDYIENLKQALENKAKKTSKETEEEEKKNLVVAQIINIEKIYKFGRRLGSGTFSTVHIGQDKRTGEKFAIKCIRKCKLSKDDLNGLFVYIIIIIFSSFFLTFYYFLFLLLHLIIIIIIRWKLM